MTDIYVSASMDCGGHYTLTVENHTDLPFHASYSDSSGWQGGLDVGSHGAARATATFAVQTETVHMTGSFPSHPDLKPIWHPSNVVSASRPVSCTTVPPTTIAPSTTVPPSTTVTSTPAEETTVPTTAVEAATTVPVEGTTVSRSVVAAPRVTTSTSVARPINLPATGGETIPPIAGAGIFLALGTLFVLVTRKRVRA